MNSVINKEERYWELTCGKEFVTVYISQNKKVYVRNFKLDYIFNTLGVNQYLYLTGISLFKEKELPDDMTDQEIEQIHKNMIMNYAIFLKTFVKCDNVQYDNVNNQFRIFNDNEIIILTNDELNILFDDFKNIYFLAGEEPFADAKPITERGKELLDIFRKAKVKVDAKKNGVMTIDSVIMGVTAKHPSYNLFNIWGLTMWQLMQTHNTLYQIDDIYFINIGIYTGNIDTKKMKTKPEELRWSVRKD